MSTGLALGLFASLVWGVVDIAVAMSSRMVGSLRVLAGSQVITLVVLLAVALAGPALLGPTAAWGFAAGLPLGVLASLTYLAYFTALRLGPVSIVSPIVVAYGGLTVVLAVMFRGETLSAGQVAGAALASTGVVLASLTFVGGSLRGARLVGPGIAAALLTMLGFAALTILMAGPIREHGWLSVAIGSRVANSTFSVLLLVIALRAGRSRFRPLLLPWHGWSRTAIVLVAVVGSLDVVGLVAYAIGLEIAPTWIVGLASSFGPVLVVVYGIVRMGERPRRTQWAGLAAITLGVLALALAG